jgi:hypothetical protein
MASVALNGSGTFPEGIGGDRAVGLPVTFFWREKEWRHAAGRRAAPAKSDSGKDGAGRWNGN